MLYRISVKTPKNQAANCMKTQKTALLGIAQASKVIDQQAIAHNEFYWTISVADGKELSKITDKCAKGEVIIRKFYQTIFHLFKRANQLCHKFKAGTTWAKQYIFKQINKKMKDSDNIKTYINAMTEKEFEDFLNITDKEEIQKLIQNDMITIQPLNE